MNHKNRSRLTVDINGDWKKYLQSHTDDDGFVAVGTVSMSDNEIYALLHCQSTEKYIAVRDGNSDIEFLKLDQRKVKAALGISNNAGAPVQLDDAKPCNLSLDAPTRAIFKRLGDGKMALGARIAAQSADKYAAAIRNIK